MKTVMRGNKQLRISDDRLEGYKTLGYVEIDAETGAPINPSVDPATLQKVHAELVASHKGLLQAHEALTEKAEKLEAENAEFRKKNEGAAVQVHLDAGSPVEAIRQAMAEATADDKTAKDPAGKK